MERDRAERIEREKKEKMEIEEARARLRSRFDEGSEDAEGVDPLAHLNDKPREPELPMTQEELLYEAAPSIPIDAILFSDEFEEALASIELELSKPLLPNLMMARYLNSEKHWLFGRRGTEKSEPQYIK